MDPVPAMLAAVLVIATLVPYGVALPSTAPAFMWSPHQDELKETVNYQTLSGQELAKSVLSEGAWSNFLCRRKKLESSVDLALVFVGTELQSGDISGIKQAADPALINLLKVSYMNSNFSMAFPYVAASEEKETMESSLMSAIMETCENDLGVSDVALLESCSVENDNFKKLADLSAVNEYLLSRVEKRPKGKPDLVVICHDSQSSGELGNLQSESEIFSQLMSSVEQSQRKYVVLYVSNPHRPSQYSSYPAIQRFLAEGTFGNESGNSTICDEVCQIKSSLLEGLLVAIVLLIILISGLCCMAGIDTPTRFEAPQDS